LVSPAHGRSRLGGGGKGGWFLVPGWGLPAQVVVAGYAVGLFVVNAVEHIVFVVEHIAQVVAENGSWST